jgi:hypothetical protein
MLAVMTMGALVLVLGSDPTGRVMGADSSWLLSFVDATTRGTPIALIVSAFVGYPLTTFLDRHGIKWYFSVLLATAAGVCLGLIVLIAAQFLDDDSGYLTFIGIYTLVASAWCAFWGTLLFRVLRAHPMIGIVCGVLVIVTSAIRAAAYL